MVGPDHTQRDGGDAALVWGSGEEMNASDTVLWRAEADRALRSPALLIEELDTVPDLVRFRDAHQWTVRMVPRLAQRVVEPPLGLGWPRWSVDPQFDLDYHVRRASLPAGGGWPALLLVAAQMAMTPFDRTRPPWQTLLVEGLPGGRAAYLIKLHHAVSDGLSGMALLAQLHSPTREPRAGKPAPPPSSEEPIGPLEALHRQVRGDTGAVTRLAGAAGGGALRALANPVGTLRSATRYAQSLSRVLIPPRATGSPLLAQRGLSWRFVAIDLAFADLRAAGKAAGGSVNDAYLAALLGGYRRYHAALGASVEAIPMTIPISLRQPGETRGGNQITAARFAGPVATADPRARIQQVHTLISAARAEPALDVTWRLAPLVARLPAPLIAPLVGPLTKGNDLQASNIPGIRHPIHIAGARIERMYAYGPLPGCAAMITMVSHGDTGCVAVNFDTAAVTRPEVFMESLIAGFTEVLSLHPGAGAAVARG
jgi:WS/DGAT/MGAT family acyltransferase